MLTSLIATSGATMRAVENIGGFAVNREGRVVSTAKSTCVYAPISEHFLKVLFDFDAESSQVDTHPGKIVSLVGHVALPCVCEVPPSCAPLFSAAGARVVSQGITWQSLYLVMLNHHFVLVEPDRQSRGDGRVVTSCPLERLLVERDPDDARADTAARRLIVTYDGSDTSPPGLFVVDSDEGAPKVQDDGPLTKLRNYSSSLDVWFEDNKAVTLAFNKVQESIAAAKIHRGHRIQRYLAQDVDSGYPRNTSLYSTIGSETM